MPQLNAVSFAAQVRTNSCGPILLARCDGVVDGAERVVAYSRVRLGLKRLADGWIPRDEVEKLPKLLLGSVVGRADPKPGQDVGWVWLRERDALLLWRGERPRATIRAGGVELRTDRGQRLFQGAQISGLQVEVSEIWDTAELLLNTSEGAATLASKTDRDVLRDPTYTEERIEADIAWMTELGEAAADLLGVLYIEPELD